MSTKIIKEKSTGAYFRLEVSHDGIDFCFLEIFEYFWYSISARSSNIFLENLSNHSKLEIILLSILNLKFSLIIEKSPYDSNFNLNAMKLIFRCFDTLFLEFFKILCITTPLLDATIVRLSSTE